MNAKKIFIISTEYLPGPGGIGSHAYQISKELFSLGWDVKVFTEQTACGEEEIALFNQNSPFKIFRLFPTPTLFSLLLKLFKLVLAVFRYNPSIILGTGKHGAWFCMLVGKLTFKKTVLIGHGTEFIITMSPRSQKINNWVYSNSDMLIHVSNYTKRIAEGAGIKNNHQVVIHNGADDKLFYRVDSDTVEKFKTENEIAAQKIILTVGYVQPRKGHEWVIRALPEILKEVPNAHYYCIGPPTIRIHLENIAKELGVENNLHFTGRILNSELLLWLNACDVFAFTSVATDYGDVEGFGIAIIEAALCGKPSVVTNESGPGEAIIENVTGLGVKERDTSAIAKNIIKLLTDDSLRARMGKDAYANAKQELTWSNVVFKYDQALTSLL